MAGIPNNQINIPIVQYIFFIGILHQPPRLDHMLDQRICISDFIAIPRYYQ